ncbi:MAG TPA: hypothetical protein DDY20_03665 [Desulfobulbaceae bacterium]|nr:hypothetical protein [Desulfobulbaceae bacterium]
MLKILTAFLVLNFIYSPAFAAWEDDFQNLYREKGIDEAVLSALADGANPDQIIRVALPLAGLTQEMLIKALFCALPQPDDIREAARANAISNAKVDEGYQLALSECARQMEENLNSAVILEPHFPSVAPSDSTRTTNYGSPWKFE